MKKLNICVDIDGTVTDPYCYLGHFNTYFEKEVMPEDFMHYRLDLVYNVSRDEMVEFYKTNGRQMHLDATVQKDAHDILWEFYKKHNVYFVTARYKEMEDTTIEWMESNSLPPVKVYSLGSHYKVDAAKELECDVFLEDNPQNAMQLAGEGINVLLVDTNYNRGVDMENIIRVHSWEEIKSVVNTLANS